MPPLNPKTAGSDAMTIRDLTNLQFANAWIAVLSEPDIKLQVNAHIFTL